MLRVRSALPHVRRRNHVRMLLPLLVIALPGALGAQGGVHGWVRERGGAPVHGASVDVAGAGAAVRTDGEGRFTLRDLDAGSVTVRVRRLGYRQASAITVVPATGSSPLTIIVEPAATTLEPVRVTARAEPFAGRLAGMERRRGRRGGHFIGPERIEQATSRSLIDLLRTAPGVHIVRGRSGQPFQVLRFRGSNCAPLMVIDGVPASAGEFDLAMIDVHTLEAVELFASFTSVPPELLGPRALERCGVIAVWSRPYRSRRTVPTADTDAQALVAGGDAYPADSVDRAAQPVRAADPMYPERMWREGKGGRVVAEFVVDTVGLVEMGTLLIVSATTPAFADAVREALAVAEFVPAVRRGRKVRQVVHQPFEFAVPGGTGAPGDPVPEARGGTPGRP